MHCLCKFLLFHLLACLGGNALGNEIINGEKVPENSMLYMVSVQNNNGHVCGGFLVSEDFVLTAAHCIDKKPTSVVVGTHNLKKADNEKRRSIEEKYKPQDYVSVGQGNNIMLLKLSGKVQWNNRVQPIQLPRSEIHMEDNEKCSVAGWGYTGMNHRSVDELRVVDVSVINQQVCREKWSGLPLNVICAGGYNTTKGFCQGDWGGPLVCKGIAVGIVSFNKNYNCNYPDVPNVYTDVSKYLPWIKKILKNKK
ncbi:duodenase-1-like [Toxotes jaculatrix]|uniref:duodenase-1-like n=1 Tax=Toxotes jaculatrix TaxID=941984 RepID=UPI001B3A89D7|nr:duodenase-1-like [Toxotes jaculatrix]